MIAKIWRSAGHTVTADHSISTFHQHRTLTSQGRQLQLTGTLGQVLVENIFDFRNYVRHYVSYEGQFARRCYQLTE